MEVALVDAVHTACLIRLRNRLEQGCEQTCPTLALSSETCVFKVRDASLLYWSEEKLPSFQEEATVFSKASQILF